MPTISRFYGILIRMNLREHNPPHIHVSYGDQECIINFLTCAVIAGSLPPKATSMAIEWTAKYKDELLEMWNTQNFKQLPPLE